MSIGTYKDTYRVNTSGGATNGKNKGFTDYGDESDPGPYPIPLNAPVEGNGVGDSHVIAVDIENKKPPVKEVFYFMFPEE